MRVARTQSLASFDKSHEASSCWCWHTAAVQLPGCDHRMAIRSCCFLGASGVICRRCFFHFWYTKGKNSKTEPHFGCLGLRNSASTLVDKSGLHDCALHHNFLFLHGSRSLSAASGELVLLQHFRHAGPRCSSHRQVWHIHCFGLEGADTA